ncbi:MAG: siroheme decarboxylase subunit beta [Desulfitobacteriaceae bacterium]
MDVIDRALLNAVQTRFPVEAHPYAVLASEAETGEAEAFTRIQILRQSGVIRRLGGVFDSQRLGYYSTLCAAKVPVDKVTVLADMLASIPGVTHNYLRDHAYNMWFTLIAPSRNKVEEILTRIRYESGVKNIFSLPALRLFKIRVDFDFGEDSSEPDEAITDEIQDTGIVDRGMVAEKHSFPLVARDIALIRVLQTDLPDNLQPFAHIASVLGWSEEEVLKRTWNLLGNGVIRRFGAVLRHQKAGFVANAMGVWQVPQENVLEAGQKMASFREVSHCYQRPSLPDWPYNLFTMVHGRSAADCKRVIDKIAEATGIKIYDMLFSTKELKKSSMQYFPDTDGVNP